MDTVYIHVDLRRMFLLTPNQQCKSTLITNSLKESVITSFIILLQLIDKIDNKYENVPRVGWTQDIF